MRAPTMRGRRRPIRLYRCLISTPRKCNTGCYCIADLLNEIANVKDCCDDFNGAVGSLRACQSELFKRASTLLLTYSIKQSSAGTLNTKQSKDGGRIVVETICAGELVEQEQHDCQKEASAIAGDEEDVLDNGPDAVSFASLANIVRIELEQQ